jgi:hypothetical protein
MLRPTSRSGSFHFTLPKLLLKAHAYEAVHRAEAIEGTTCRPDELDSLKDA